MVLGVEHNRWKPEHPIFENRWDAGEKVGKKLIEQYGKETLERAVIVGCPRGGLVVAQAVSHLLQANGCLPTFDLVVCRKIPLPHNVEYGIGGVTEQGHPFFVPEFIHALQVDVESLAMQEVIQHVQEEVQRRIQVYRYGQDLPSLEGKVVVIVDDGIAGGVTTITAIRSIRERAGSEMARLIVAVPIMSLGARNRVMKIESLSEEDFCTAVVATPPPGRFWDLEDYYFPGGFPEVSDEQVVDIMKAESPLAHSS